MTDWWQPIEYGWHGPECPKHCVCNGTHVPGSCWCSAPRWKAARPPATLRERLSAAFRGGGRAPIPPPPRIR